MGDLAANAALPRLGRVTLADGKQNKRWPIGLAVDVEDRTPLTVGLRDVVLNAASELRPVAGFGITRTQRVYGDTTLPSF